MRNKSSIAAIGFFIFIIFSLMGTFLVEISAQSPPKLFANSQNLRVLPTDISAELLRSTMIGFTQALDVRCSTCHAGEESEPLTEYDFASDEKESKLIAREMLRMINAINESVVSLDRGAGHEYVEVSCMTCHRGQSLPRI